MSFQFTIKKCLISVDGKKYTKNEISIGNRYMFIHYGKPGKYTGRIMIDMTNPSEQVSKIEYNDTNHVLKFKWKGLWENEDTGKESQKILDFKIEFERPVDGERVYSAALLGLHAFRLLPAAELAAVRLDQALELGLGREEDCAVEPGLIRAHAAQHPRAENRERVYSALIKKLPLKKGRHTRRNPVRTKRVKKRIKSKKKGRKGPEESATKYPVGTEKKGNDGNMWVINASKKGIQRWVKKEDKSARGKNKSLEKLWTDMSNMKKLVFIMKDGSHQIKSIQKDKYQDHIDKGNNDPNVKAILTAGNSFDGYQQLYDKVKQSSIPGVLKNYKKYWKYKMDDKLYTC